jgi:hypothetical protein
VRRWFVSLARGVETSHRGSPVEGEVVLLKVWPYCRKQNFWAAASFDDQLNEALITWPVEYQNSGFCNAPIHWALDETYEWVCCTMRNICRSKRSRNRDFVPVGDCYTDSRFSTKGVVNYWFSVGEQVEINLFLMVIYRQPVTYAILVIALRD